MDTRPKLLRWFDRLSFPLEVVGTATGLTLVWYFTNISGVAIGGSAIGLGAARLWQPLKRRFGINTGWAKTPLGLALLGLGIYSFTYPDGIELLKSAFLLVGGWLTLDGLYDLTSGTGATVAGAPDPMERFGDAHIVGHAIETEPQSIEELTATVDLSRHRIEGALAMLLDTDVVVERNGRYYATLSERTISDVLKNAPSRASDRVRSLPDRLWRPFRLFKL